MDKIFVLGIGGSASFIVNQFININKNKENIVPLILDTDLASLDKYDVDYKIELTKNEVIYETVKRVGIDNIKSWFETNPNQPNTNFMKRVDMHKGCHLWRQQSLLAFEDFIRGPKNAIFFETIDKMFEEYEEGQVNQFYIISSICGGTGSGLLLPLSMYIKQYINEKYRIDIKFNALLTCPDIYINELVADNKTKCYANAYATMQEIDNIDKVTKGYNDNIESKSFNIDIKLEYFNKMLFDSNDKNYQKRENFPFENIYLIDKLPTIDSITTHELYIVNVLKNLITNYKTQNEVSDIVYQSLFVKKVIYPYQHTLKYVVSQKALDDIKNEWLYFYNFVEEQVKLSSEDNNKLYNNSSSTVFLNILDQIDGNSNLDECILNRYSNLEEYEKIIKYDNKYEKKYVEKIAIEIEDVILNYCYNFDSEELEEQIKEQINITPLSFFDTKSKKDQKKEVILKEVRNFIIELKKYYYKKLKNIEEDQNKFIEQNLITLIKKVVVDEQNTYVHPMIAYIRLNRLYKNINGLLTSQKLLDIKNLYEYNEIILPDIIFDIEEDPEAKKKRIEAKEQPNSYIAAGRSRFARLLQNDAKHLKSLEEEYESIKMDFKMIIQNLKEQIALYYNVVTLNVLNVLLNNYYQVFKKTKKVYEDLEDEVKVIKLLGSSDSSILKNLKSQEKYKTSAYEAYKKANDKYYDNISGYCVFEKVFECSFTNKGVINSTSIHHIYDSIVSTLQCEVLENKEIKKLVNKNILEILINDDLFDESEFDFTELRKKMSPLTNGTITPLNIYVPKGDDTQSPVIIKSISLSNEIKDYIILNKDKLNQEFENVEDIVNTFFYMMGNTNSNIIVDKTLSDKEFVLTEHITNMRLNWFKKLDELCADYSYFKYYDKIIKEDKILLSELWNPHIYSLLNNDTSLIYLNPDKQIEFEESTFKALLCLLLKNQIYTDIIKEDDYKPVYYIMIDGKPIIPQINNKPIYEENFDDLLKYLKSNKNLISEMAHQFDEFINKEKSLYNLDKKHKINEDFVMKKIEKNQLFKLMIEKIKFSKGTDNKKLIHILYEIYEKNKSNKDPILMIQYIIKILNDIINNYLEELELDVEKIKKGLYKQIINSDFDYIKEKDKSKKIISWIKKQIV